MIVIIISSLRQHFFSLEYWLSHSTDIGAYHVLGTVLNTGLSKIRFKSSLETWQISFEHKSGQVSAAAAKSLQSCPRLCDPIDGSSPGCPVPGILQARTLERVAISFSNALKWKVKVKSLSHVRPSATWTAAFQAPPPMGFSRQQYWSGVPLPSP